LAASAGSLPLTAVYGWLNDAREDQAVALLRAEGHELAGQSVRGVLGLPDKQRAGVMGTAKKMLSFIADPALAAWVVDPVDGRPRFDASRFLEDRSTLYSLSKEGPGSAGPLTAALTAAVLAAAERKASRSPAGRLPVPLVGVLDEVANVCRWRDLPDLYSHYGSRGIVLMSFLQSWSQGVECWGREGMKKLWGAANLRVYGGGANDAELLEDISRMCGEFQAPTSSASYRSGQRTTTAGERPQRVFDIATLAALPAGRAVVMLSGARPVLVATESVHAGPHAAAVRESIATYGQL
jgi:type IV secretory pathway TraG/TraD family ATPase VirD4